MHAVIRKLRPDREMRLMNIEKSATHPDLAELWVITSSAAALGAVNCSSLRAVLNMHLAQKVQQEAALWFHFEANTFHQKMLKDQINVRNVNPIMLHSGC